MKNEEKESAWVITILGSTIYSFWFVVLSAAPLLGQARSLKQSTHLSLCVCLTCPHGLDHDHSRTFSPPVEYSSRFASPTLSKTENGFYSRRIVYPSGSEPAKFRPQPAVGVPLQSRPSRRGGIQVYTRFVMGMEAKASYRSGVCRPLNSPAIATNDGDTNILQDRQVSSL